jgi:SET domain-containing protein
MSLSVRKRILPHNGVYVRLGASTIHGVGVFAVRRIKKGTNPFKRDNSNMIWVSAKKLSRLPPNIKKLYQDFGVLTNGRYGVPPSFNQLTPAWYINESTTPNMRCGKDYDFFAARDIEVGEELTLNYSTYSE